MNRDDALLTVGTIRPLLAGCLVLLVIFALHVGLWHLTWNQLIVPVVGVDPFSWWQSTLAVLTLVVIVVHTKMSRGIT